MITFILDQLVFSSSQIVCINFSIFLIQVKSEIKSNITLGICFIVTTITNNLNIHLNGELRFYGRKIVVYVVIDSFFNPSDKCPLVSKGFFWTQMEFPIFKVKRNSFTENIILLRQA